MSDTDPAAPLRPLVGDPCPEECWQDLTRAGRELLARYRRVAPEPGPGRAPYAVRVRIEEGPELPALLLLDSPQSEIRLVSASSLLGYKARILVPRTGGGVLVAWDMRVLWVERLAAGLFENGMVFLEVEGKGAEFNPNTG